MNYTLYAHICPNGKLYIGITSRNVKYRWKDGGVGYSTQQLFWRAIQKYGWDNIKHIVLLNNLTKEVACECERYLISKYQSNNSKFGYNIYISGDLGALGVKHTEETKKKISANRKGKALGHIVTEETRKKISEANKGKCKGRIVPQDVRQKISIANKGKPNTWQKGKPLSVEIRKKISEANKGHIVTEETREKIRIANTGKHHTEETKKKLSDNNKSGDPVVRKKISESLKKSSKERVRKRLITMQEKYPDGYKQSEESNRKRSEALRGITRSEKTRKKMSKPKSEETKRKMREAQVLSHRARKMGMTYKEYLETITNA